MMFPILISVSVAPGSYFFSAAAGFVPTARPSTTDASKMSRLDAMPPSLVPSAARRSCPQSRIEQPELSSSWTALRQGGFVIFKRLTGDDHHSGPSQLAPAITPANEALLWISQRTAAS